jgi:hypothetical protein
MKKTRPREVKKAALEAGYGPGLGIHHPPASASCLRLLSAGIRDVPHDTQLDFYF